MKTKKDIEKAYEIGYEKYLEAKRKEDKEMIEYYIGFLNALDWVKESHENGILNTLPLL